MANSPERDKILKDCNEALDECVRVLKTHFNDVLDNGYFNWYRDWTLSFHKQQFRDMQKEDAPYHHLVTPLHIVAKAFLIWWVSRREEDKALGEPDTIVCAGKHLEEFKKLAESDKKTITEMIGNREG